MDTESNKKPDITATTSKPGGLPSGKKAIKEALNRKPPKDRQRTLRKHSKLHDDARQRLEGGPTGFAPFLSWRTKAMLATVIAAAIGLMMWTSNLKRVNIARSMIFEYAAEGNTKGVKAVIAEYPEAVFMMTENNWTPLHSAAARGHLETVQALIERQASPEMRNIDQRVPLHYAADGGHTDITRLLLNAGGSANPVDKFGRLPIHLAAGKGHLDLVQLLAEAKSQIGHADTFGITPLHLAAGNGHHEVVEFLIQLRATLDDADSEGLTPLHLAAENGHTRTIELLLEAGADASIKEASGKTPLDLALATNHLEAAERLKRLDTRNALP